MEFDRENNVFSNGDLKIPADADFIAAHDLFYGNAIEKYRAFNDTFDEKAREFILKTLSVTGEYSENKKQKVHKKGLINAIKRLIDNTKAKDEPVDLYKFEREVCAGKLAELKKCLSETHTYGMRAFGRGIQCAFQFLRKRYGGANLCARKSHYRRRNSR